MFRRIWLQFADSDQGVLASEAVDIADLLTQQIGWSNSDTTRKVLWDTIRQVTERQDNVRIEANIKPSYCLLEMHNLFCVCVWNACSGV